MVSQHALLLTKLNIFQSGQLGGIFIRPFFTQMLVDVSSSLSTSCCSVTSILRLKEVTLTDSGKYTCRPAGVLAEDMVDLHVLPPPVVEQRLPSNLPSNHLLWGSGGVGGVSRLDYNVMLSSVYFTILQFSL